MRKSARLVVFAFVFLFCFLFFPPKDSFAVISGCTISGELESIDAGTTNDFTFTVVNNDGENSISYIKIIRPSSHFTINTGESSDSYTNSEISIGPGGFYQQIISVSAGLYNMPSASWVIQTSDSTSGDNLVSCGGQSSTAIVNGISPISILEVTISGVSATSATISWTTDASSTSLVNYGTSTDYGLTETSSSLVTSHSLILNSLTANTTYHFKVSSTDGSGNNVETQDYTFTTAASASVTSAPAQTVTVTRTITPSPTPTPAPDLVKPNVVISTSFLKPFASAPQILGRASDNKDVSKIEYSLDNGRNWLPVDNILSLGSLSTSFSFVPPNLDDGNYSLKVRAQDLAGNIGITKSYSLIIDRLSPQISGSLFSLGPQVIVPEKDGSVVTVVGQKIKLTLSDVGGATSMDVFVDDTTKPNSDKFSLTKDSESGLWSAILNFKRSGKYQLRFSAIDGAGNVTDRNLNTIFVADKGLISDTAKNNIKDAKITVYYLESKSNTWQIWDGNAYLQENPLKTDSNGNYSLFLPSGKFYMHIEANGYQAVDSSIFLLKTASPVNANFMLKSLKLLFSLGPVRLYFPDFTNLTAPFVNNLPKLASSTNKLINNQIPFFNLAGFSTDSVLGKPSVITFLNLWSPYSSQQVSILNDFYKIKEFNARIIVEGEKATKVDVFQKRGEYIIPLISDQDATLIDSFSLNVLPTHFFLDRKGVVKEVISGVLSKEELANILINNSQ